jgi:hypothetical protein
MAVLYLKKFLLNIVYWHDDKAFLRRVTHHVLKVWNVLEYEFWLKVIPCLLMKSVIQRFRDKQYTNVHLHRNYNHTNNWIIIEEAKRYCKSIDFLWRLVTSDSTTAVLCDSKRHLISIVKYDDQSPLTSYHWSQKRPRVMTYGK